MRQFLFIALTLLVSCKQGNDVHKSIKEEPFWSAEKAPEKIGKMIADELFTRSDFFIYNTPEVYTFHYAEACAAFGVGRFANLTGDSALLQQLISRYENVVDSGLISDVGHVDVNVYGILPIEISLHTGDKAAGAYGIMLADKQWEDPLPNGMSNQTRYWIDDIYMIASLQVQAYRATGDMVYLDRAALEVDNYLKKLQQENGLFHHGENAPFFWGRGNGWVASGLAELIAVLPESNEHYEDIVGAYVKMMDALLTYQAEDGMWRQLIDHEDAWVESSATAMFGFALSEGVYRGILQGEKYRNAYQKAWLALCDYVDEEGKLEEVCVGTGQSLETEYYMQRPKTTGDFHGQAPMLWFACSLLKNN